MLRIRSSQNCGNDRAHSADWMVDSAILPPHAVTARVALSALDGTQGVLVTNLGESLVIVIEGTPLGVAERVTVASAPFPTTMDPAADDGHANASTSGPPAGGQVRTVSQDATEANAEVDPDSEHYDSDEPNEWESEIDRQSTRPIDELLSSRPTRPTSPPRIANAKRGHTR